MGFSFILNGALLSPVHFLQNTFHLYSKICLILCHDHVFKIKTILFRYPTKD